MPGSEPASVHFQEKTETASQKHLSHKPFRIRQTLDRLHLFLQVLEYAEEDRDKKQDAQCTENHPPITPEPKELLPLAPAPEENISGNKPKIIARMVIRIGRNRTLTDAKAACAIDMPSLRRSTAYSVSRIAVFDSKPINMIKPVCR